MAAPLVQPPQLNFTCRGGPILRDPKKNQYIKGKRRRLRFQKVKKIKKIQSDFKESR